MLYQASMDYQQTICPYGYLYLEVPPSKEGKEAFEKENFHIFPRDGYFSVVLPEKNKKFSSALYLPQLGQNSFNTLS